MYIKKQLCIAKNERNCFSNRILKSTCESVTRNTSPKAFVNFFRIFYLIFQIFKYRQETDSKSAKNMLSYRRNCFDTIYGIKTTEKSHFWNFFSYNNFHNSILCSYTTKLNRIQAIVILTISFSALIWEDSVFVEKRPTKCVYTQENFSEKKSKIKKILHCLKKVLILDKNKKCN